MTNKFGGYVVFYAGVLILTVFIITGMTYCTWLFVNCRGVAIGLYSLELYNRTKGYGVQMKKTGTYIKISNSDKKVWILPVDNLQLALNLYQPSSIKGRLLKKWFPLIYHVPMVSQALKNALRIEQVEYSITNELALAIEKAFNEDIDNLSLAFFLGTPSVHQKTTIQISKGKKILGYCKYTSDEQIIRLFKHEEHILDGLIKVGINNIPKCLFCGRTDSNYGVFIQSTKKTKNSIITHTLTKKHVEFLQNAFEKTKTKCQYLSTEYHRFVGESSRLLMQSDIISRDEKLKFAKAIERINHYYSNQYEFCVFHADFTPWNMFEENGKLFVFDWEYSKLTFPPFIDLFHFFTQSEIFENGKNANEIVYDFEKEFTRQVYDGLFEDKETAYLSYLIYIVGFYTNRDKGVFSKDINRCIRIWIQLIAHLVQM